MAPLEADNGFVCLLRRDGFALKTSLMCYEETEPSTQGIKIFFRKLKYYLIILTGPNLYHDESIAGISIYLAGSNYWLTGRFSLVYLFFRQSAWHQFKKKKTEILKWCQFKIKSDSSHTHANTQAFLYFCFTWTETSVFFLQSFKSFKPKF